MTVYCVYERCVYDEVVCWEPIKIFKDQSKAINFVKERDPEAKRLTVSPWKLDDPEEEEDGD
ncbi:MAG TPA: hypothetical protein VD994_02400 [Prosthecobacter sp.]|nr:hypothetical protein [Prosthecobacter sp.]